MSQSNQIFKVNYYSGKDRIEKVVVFYGINLSGQNLNELFKTDNKNVAFNVPGTDQPIFSDEELARLVAGSVEFVEEEIHIDDSIAIIKLKIVEAFSKTFSVEELYMFCTKEQTINSAYMYQTLTQNNRLQITRLRLDQFLFNILLNADTGEPFQPAIPEKEYYDYDDILALGLDGKRFIVDTVLGQKLFIIKNEYPFVVNPFKINDYDRIIERASRKSLTTLNKHLLLDTGFIIGNNIYICLAENVLSSLDDSVKQAFAAQLYYPFLSNMGIKTVEEIQENKQRLIDETAKMLRPSVLQSFESVNLFYDVYREKTSDLRYKSKGIKSIRAILRPDVQLKIPLEIIFKIVHATKTVPLIKYNPATRQENVYRLYTKNLTKDGRKIPYLPRATVFRIMRTVGKSRSVTAYIEYHVSGKYKEQIICEFEESGNIVISAEFEKVFSVESIDKLFIDSVNPIIEDVKMFFEQSGYKIALFTSLFDDNVEIADITYQTVINIHDEIRVKSIAGCVSSVFNIEKDNLLEDNIEMRFKRVSNFNKVTSQEAFVIDQQKKGLRGDEIIEALVSNYEGMTRGEAEGLLQKLANELQVERGVKKKDIEIKINPGFKTIITINRVHGNITVKVDGINSIYYLSTIPIYIDTLIRLTQGDQTTDFPKDIIDNLCRGGEKEGAELDDIISSAELEMPRQERSIISAATPIGEEDEELEEDIEDQDQGTREEEDLLYVPAEEEEESPQETEAKTKNVLDLLYGDDEEEEEEGSDGRGLKGGAPTQKQTVVALNPVPVPKIGAAVEPRTPSRVRNIDNMRLSKPYYFEKRMEDRDPQLFSTLKDDKFKAYSRMCPSNKRRQPVILSKEELDEVNREHPGYFDENDVLEYGSSPDNKFYYTCPRYWCLLTDKVMTDDQVKAGECGGKIIPFGEKKVPPGHYIYEFYNPDEHGSQDAYEKHYPGFHKESAPDGNCIPCCMKKWNVKKQIEKKEICGTSNPALNIAGEEVPTIQSQKTQQMQADVLPAIVAALKAPLPISEDEGMEEAIVTPRPDATPRSIREEQTPRSVGSPRVEENDEYIKGPEKFPLRSGRWGYLPMGIQKFLHEVNAKCQISKTNTNLKPFHTCLLRHGVEDSKNQSFVACIADAMYFVKSEVPTIKQMKQQILSAITLDSFVTFQNGNLATNFANKDIDSVDTAVLEKYNETKMYMKIADKTSDEDMGYFKKLVGAYENFIAFLKDDTVVIDYTYLWDIVCSRNPGLFKDGLNLIILNIPENDPTDNVELVCPTNHYANEFYETRKQTLILIQKRGRFEPIYSYRDEQKKINVSKTFSEYDPKLSPTMRAIFKKVIKPVLKNMCSPLPSIPNEYRFKQPILLSDIIKILTKKHYEIEAQVVNYNSQVIGVKVLNKRDGTRGYVPCAPSSLLPGIDFVYILDANIWQPYNETLAFLNGLHSTTGISCNPVKQIVEDEMVVGFITQTNQFVQLSEPYPVSSINNTIKSVNDSDYLVADAATTTSNAVDTKRVETVKRIKMETNFFNVFRNTVRILLNDYENIEIRKEIEEETNNRARLYNSKLRNVIRLLKELASNIIIFADEYDLSLVEEVSTCIVKNPDKCSKTAQICTLTEGDRCSLVLPKKNLVTGSNNETHYYGRMADELIRYNRIKSFIFKPNSYLSFGSVGYNLREDEMIIIQSLLTQEYFDSLIPAEINKYSKFSSYNDAEPILTQEYSTRMNIDSAIHPEESNECLTKYEKLQGEFVRSTFPADYKELKYADTSLCSFYVIIDIIQVVVGKRYDIAEIRNELFSEYNKYLDRFEMKIVDLLIMQGKKTEGDQVKHGVLSFQNLLFADNYYLTKLDIWMLLERFKIPSFFISNKPLMETDFKSNCFSAYSLSREEEMGERSVDEEQFSPKYAFIFTPPNAPEKIPKYKVITDKDNGVLLNLSVLKNPDVVYEAMEDRVTIEDFLQNFKRASKTVYKPRKAKKPEVEFVVEGEEEAAVPKVKKQTIRKPKTIVAPELEIQQEEEKQEPESYAAPNPLVMGASALQKQTVQPKVQSGQEEAALSKAEVVPSVGADEMIFEVNEDTLKRQKRTTRGKKRLVLKRSRKINPLIMSAVPEATEEEKEA